MPPADPPDAGRISRRRALRVGGGGVLAIVIGGVAAWADRRGTDPEGAPAPAATITTTTRSAVIPEIGDIDPRIITLGRRVMEVTGENDLSALLATLPESGDSDPIVTAARQVRSDFESGETITVDGWVLAASEARASAVVALLCDDAAC